MKRQVVISWGVAIVMVAGLGAVAAVKTAEQPSDVLLGTAALDPECDLHQGVCSVSVPDLGTVSLSIEPRPIPVIKPLHVTVQTDGFAANAVTVDFNGVNMNMGINRYAMIKQGENRFEGDSMLPVCVRNRMAWQADVQVETAKGMYVFPFRFDTFAKH